MKVPDASEALASIERARLLKRAGQVQAALAEYDRAVALDQANVS